MSDCAKKYWNFLLEAKRVSEKIKEEAFEYYETPRLGLGGIIIERIRRLNPKKFEENIPYLDNLKKYIDEMEQEGCMSQAKAEEIRTLIDEAKEKHYWKLNKAIQQTITCFIKEEFL